MKVLPGTSRVLTLFAKTDGLHFSSKHEPEDFMPEFNIEIREFEEKEGCYNIVIDFTDEEDYYAQGEKMRNSYIETIHPIDIINKTKDNKEEKIKTKYIK